MWQHNLRWLLLMLQTMCAYKYERAGDAGNTFRSSDVQICKYDREHSPGTMSGRETRGNRASVSSTYYLSPGRTQVPTRSSVLAYASSSQNAMNTTSFANFP